MPRRDKNSTAASDFNLQALESRRLLSAAIPLLVTTVSTPLGEELCITGAKGNNSIVIEQTSTAIVVKTSTGWKGTYRGQFAELRVTGGSGNNIIKLESNVTIPATLVGAGGNDTLYAGSGTDELIAGPHANFLIAGAGNDTLVSVGSQSDTLEGGAGLDSFWADDKSSEVLRHVTAAELNDGAVHQIPSFLSTYSSTAVPTAIPSTLKGQNLPEPSVNSYATAWANFSSDPLFSAAGPSENDIEQGSVGDCYFLSSLSSIAKINPQVIRQSIVSLGDGTYAVRFMNDGTPTYVRVDARLPVYFPGSGPAYAKLGAQDSTWVALIEKAWADFRIPQTSSYNAIAAGDMSQACDAMGLDATDDWSFSSATDLADYLETNLNAGNSVTYSTESDTAQLIGDHAYTVDSIQTDSKGNVTSITLRNPWGPQSPNNGYVTLTPADLFADLSDVVTATF